MLLICCIISGVIYLITRLICLDMAYSGQWLNPHNHIGLLFLINRFFKWTAIITFVIFIIGLIF